MRRFVEGHGSSDSTNYENFTNHNFPSSCPSLLLITVRKPTKSSLSEYNIKDEDILKVLSQVVKEKASHTSEDFRFPPKNKWDHL